MKNATLSLLTFLIIAVAGPSLVHAQEAIVSASDSAFAPRTITVPAGTTVTWTNNGQMPHTVTADDGRFDSGTFAPGRSYSRRFPEPGTYPYFCRLHGAPGGVGMAGVVVVTAGGAALETIPQPQLVPMRNIPYTGSNDIGFSVVALLGLMAFATAGAYLVHYYARRAA